MLREHVWCSILLSVVIRLGIGYTTFAVVLLHGGVWQMLRLEMPISQRSNEHMPHRTVESPDVTNPRIRTAA